MKDSFDIEKRDAVAWANFVALSALMAKHGLFIPAKEFPLWRPTKPSSGSIPGVAQSVTIIATNGILGYFVYDDPSVPVLCGHTQCFDGRVEPLYSTTVTKPTKERVQKPSKASREAQELLKQLLESQNK